MASYVEDDGVTVNLVTVGSGTPAKRLPEIYPSRAEAAAGANAHLVAGDVSRDFVEITTGFTPRAQVLQPLTIVNAGPTIPIGFPPLVVRSVQHTIGRAAAVSIITARPAASQGDELFTFLRFPSSQWKALRTTNALERINEEFRRRTKTQASLPGQDAVLLLLFGLLRSGQVKLRALVGYQDMEGMKQAA